MGMKFPELARATGATVCLSCCVTLAFFSPPTFAQEPAPPQESIEPASGTVISEAQEHYRMGVTLYRQGNFREALDEFNRALALDPDYEDAKKFRDDAQTQVDITATGVDPTARPQFESFDPESLGISGESPQLSAEEFKIQRVRELVELGESYLEYGFYQEAVEYFEQVLLIAPDNLRAKKGLHTATMGRYEQTIKEEQGKVREEIGNIRTQIERMKQLPPGADASGIRNPRIDVPRVDERAPATTARSRVDDILDSPITVQFEEVHLSEILEFVNEIYEVNIVVDNRTVLSAEDAARLRAGVTAGQAPAGAQAGARPQQQGGAAARRQQQQQPAGLGSLAGGGGGGNQQNQQLGGELVTDGMVQYINLKDVSLREALKAILHPLNLDFSVQGNYLWISTPENIRTEAFEDLETRVYMLENAGAETLFKLVLTQEAGRGDQFILGGNTGGGGGGQGGGGGGLGGGGGGGGLGGGGGGGLGGGGGQGGGGGLGGGGGGQGGGQGGGSESGFTNISELFDTISDEDVGEFPNPFDQAGAGGGGFGGGQQGGGGFGGGGGGGQGGQGGNQFFGGPGPGLGFAEGFFGESTAIQMLRSLVPPVIEPVTQRLLSYMRYNLLTNQLVVHQTPTNHRRIESLLKDFDIRSSQVSIEAKFVNLSIGDTDKVGFNWTGLGENNTVFQDPRNPANPANLPDLDIDADGDGDIDTIPPNIDPTDGSTRPGFDFISSLVSIAGMAFSPGPDGASIGWSIIDNANGTGVNVTFEFLNQLGETEVLSSPRVTTMNQKPAVIADITEEYFQIGLLQSIIFVQDTGTDGSPPTQNLIQSPIIEAFIFGYTLSVTPYIAGDQVRLWLNPQVTDKTGVEKTFTFNTAVNGEPVTNNLTFPTVRTQSVWTNVIVSDGDTLVLGGLITDRTTKNESKVPYLGDIPVIGFFFRGKSREVSQSSLLIFVTPTIIDPSGARYFEPQL